ncbi:MAG: Ig-like domain-containing protein [Candidatus Eisenbacteria bacterium]|uniref:Ig-like domain-containing protein n=1 Tax=Eiseniibacteriota bacterium TaxID=2212470 RepID=A0A956NHS8_UNCEI|nr:Ig-like domain-containing protein [Candidatus Eisenbacteria bacterium]
MVRLNLEFPSPRGGFLMAVSAVALAAVASPSLAIDVVRSENWDGDWAANWTIEGGVWEVGRPLNTGIGEPTLPAGQNCAATSLNANYPDGADARLVWSLMDIPATNPRLRFSHWMRMQSNDYGYIAIRIEGSDLWTEVSDFCADVGRGDQNSCAIAFDTHDVWVPVSIDLSDYAGERAEVAFVFHSNSAYNDVGWYIDNVQMESGGYDFDLAQGWESGFQGWHAAMGDWEVGTPNVEGGPGAPQSGSSCIGTLLTTEYPKHHSSRLVSPFFEVPADRARLRFWQWLNCHSGDLGTVWIRQRDADVWTKIGEDTPTDTYGVWAPVTLDLSRFAGTEVELSFLFNATSGYRDAGWFLDGIQIESGDYEVPLVEDWEDGYGDWSAPQGVWEIGDPVGGPGEPSRGEACIGTLLNVNYPTWVQVNLVSPPMEIPAAGSAFLRFHQWMRVRSNDSGRVDYLAPGDEWRNLLQVASTTSGWEEVSIALPNNLNGENVQFRFQFSSISGYSDAGWFLDDISVASATPPTVSAVQPQSGTVVGASRPSIEVQFDQSVLGATTASAWEVEGSVSGTHNGQVTSVDNTTVRFEPSSDFVDGETVTVTLNPSSSVITSADGIPLARYDWSFGVAFDSVCPTVASITPVDGATNIEPQSRIRVVFDEPVVGADDVLAWSVESARAGALQGQVKLIGCCTYEWHPDAALPYGDTITIRLDADRIQDLSGNDMCGDYHASFTVREIVAQPTTYTYTPAIPGGRYVLITVPLDVEAGDHLSDVFSALGSMSESKWLGYGFENEEYRLDPGVVAGKGYWIALAAENSRAVQITGNAHSDPVRVELEAGWNLVGVPWISEQFFWADQAVDTGTEFVSFGSEEARDWIADAVYWYEDDSADLQNNGGYQYRTTADGATLAENPWGGYFVYAEQDCELVFSQTPLRSGVSLAQHRTMSRKIPSWSVSIRASAGSGSDGNVRIGTVASAREVEVRKPPLPTGSVSLSVEESGHSFLTSYRGEGSVDSWLLGLSGPAESVTLTWEGVESLPAGQNLYLRTESGRVVRMGDSGELNVWNPGHSRIEVFSSMTELSDATPQNLQLRPMQNPLRGRGTFELSLPESGPVEVQIVDVTGRSVATLVSGWREAGTHSLEWSPATEQLPGGIYFARVQAGREVAREKLIVLR